MSQSGRRRFLVGASALLAAPLAVAQQPGRRYRVGAIIGSPAMQFYVAVLKERLASHGFVEGRNLQIDARGAAGMFHEDRETARELVAAKSDALFTCLTGPTIAARTATKTVPIVFVWVEDPVALGIVKNYARPGGNATGVTTRFGELLVKKLELVRELVPGVQRVAIPGTDSTSAPWTTPMRKAAADLGIKLLEPEAIGGVDAVGPRLLDQFIRDGAQALVTFHFHALQPVSGAEMIRLAAERRIPAIYSDAAAVQDGGLISLGTNLAEDLKRGADMLAQVLKGAKPAELPVDQASRFELVVNLKTARTLGIKVPQSVLLRADRVIE
jgi:ABC-type uncharacterized transport system substrate-binding protein